MSAFLHVGIPVKAGVMLTSMLAIGLLVEGGEVKEEFGGKPPGKKEKKRKKK
jgi:hypothetical protein